MVTEITSKVRRQKKGSRYESFYIYLPLIFAKDSAFPFKADEDIILRIDTQNKRIIIESVNSNERDVSENEKTVRKS